MGKKKKPSLSAGRPQRILLAIVLILSLSVWVVNWARTPELALEALPADGRSVLAELEWEYHSCRPQGDWVVATDANPRAYFSGFSGEVQTVAVRLRTELDPGVPVTLYYPDRSGTYSTDRMDRRVSSGGMKEFLFTVPLGEYPSFRLDIPGNYRLADVLISPSPMAAESHVIPSFRLRDLLVIFLITLALAEALLFQWPRLSGWLKKLWQGRKAYGLAVLKALAAGAACALLAWPVCHWRGIPYLWQQIAFFFLGGLTAGGLWAMRRRAADHPQRIFALLCLGLGLLFILSAPLTAYITQDGGIHYQHALSLSYGGDAYVTRAEKALMNLEGFPGYWYLAGNHTFASDLQDGFDAGAVYTFRENVLRPSFLGYLPGAAGLWLGRFLGLPVLWNYALGRLANLLAYTILVCLAVKRARRGKALLCTVGLLPTAVFQAASYSYLPFVMGVGMVAMVLFMNEAQQPEKPITLGKTAGILGLLLAAFLPRPVCFPVVLALFFIPRTKLPDRTLRRRYMLLTALAVLILAAALLLPFLTGQPAATDPRGGLPVTASAQLRHILTNPVDYAKVFVKFIAMEYLNPNNAGRVLTELGSFSNLLLYVPGAILVLALLALVALTEPEDHLSGTPERAVPWPRLGAALGVCCAIGVTATWCYAAFTPVSASTILGCQGRYLLPLLFPALCIFRSDKIKSTFHKGAYLYTMLCPLALLTYGTLWMILRCYR